MNIEYFRNYCLAKAGVTEETPFDQVTLTFKVMGKIFAITNIDTYESINLKCDPERAVQIREEYHNIVLPGWHMNKKHWNTIKTKAGIPDKKLEEWIDHSYDLVVAKLTKKLKEELKKCS